MIRRVAASAALAVAALAAPASAGAEVCTPSAAGVTLGGCVHVVCLKLCVTQIEVDPRCSLDLDRPLPLPVQFVCSQIEQQFIPIGG